MNREALSRKKQVLETLFQESQGTVTVLEAKSKFLTNFAVYQMFHPIKYYLQRALELGIEIPHINACYALSARQGRSSITQVRMYLYAFDDPDRLDSIRLVRKAEYHLLQR